MTQIEAPATVLHAGALAFDPNFPVIRHIDDIRPHLRPSVGINIYDRGDLLVIDYAVSLPETFLTPFDLECRGLVFDSKTGLLLSRPFHKTFTLNERQSAADLDFSEGAWVEDKLDGSMIGAFCRAGEVVLHTCGGITDHALRARLGATPDFLALADELFHRDHTLISEWTGPQNKIVVPYASEKLTPLAARHRTSGRYMRRDDLERLARQHGQDLVPLRCARIGSAEELLAYTASVQREKGSEGGMVCFPSGHRVKIKSLDYLRRNRIISNIESQKNVLRSWTDGSLDDIAAFLADERGEKLAAYGADLDRMALAQTERLKAILEGAPADPRGRADYIKKMAHPLLQPKLFALARDPHCGPDQIRRLVEHGLVSLDRMNQVHEVLDLPQWDFRFSDLRS